MKKTKKVIVALVLAFIMAAVPAIPFMQPMVVLAEEAPALGEQGFVPIRAIFEEAAEESGEEIVITWNRVERNIHIALDGGSIVFTPGSNVAHVNGIAIDLEHAITLEQGVSYIFIDDLLLVLEVFMIMGLHEIETFAIHLTEEARDMVLYDFDFIVSAIRENSPWETVIDRRLGDINFMDHINELREFIYSMTPIVFPLSLEDFEAAFGAPIYEVMFPIRDDSTRGIAATYLSYLLFEGLTIPFEAVGHLMVRQLGLFRSQYSMFRILYHHGEIDRETDPFNAMRHDVFTHPDVVWFYGEIEVDLYADVLTAIPNVPGNITTKILVPDEIAYLGIGSFAANWDYDNFVTIPFFEEIQDFDHLILDLRGNGGGFSEYFPSQIMSRLINEPIEVVSHQFFSSGPIAVETMDAFVQTAANVIEYYDVSEWFSVDIMSAQDFIAEQGMTAINQADFANLEYVLLETEWFFPNDDGILFDGKVWLLVDQGTASASSQATMLLINSGRATVVGQNTSGVMWSTHVYVMLPNTGMLFRIDIGYMTDADGVSLEAYGIAPHVRNFEGMDALETVLELIAEWEAQD